MVLERLDITSSLSEDPRDPIHTQTPSGEGLSRLNPQRPWLSVIIEGSSNAKDMAEKAARLASEIGEKANGARHPNQVEDKGSHDWQTLVTVYRGPSVPSTESRETFDT